MVCKGEHRDYTGSGQASPTSSGEESRVALHRGACSRGLQARREREALPGLLCVSKCLQVVCYGYVCVGEKLELLRRPPSF